MAGKPKPIKSGDVLPPGEVGQVRTEEPRERVLRIFMETGIRTLGAFVIAIAGFCVLLYIVLSDNPHVEHFREGAFAALTTTIGAAVGLLFGGRRSDH